VRCRHCHLTLASEELRDGFCPECFDASGIKRYEFDEVKNREEAAARYRCEACGVVVTSK